MLMADKLIGVFITEVNLIGGGTVTDTEALSKFPSLREIPEWSVGWDKVNRQEIPMQRIL
jgi:hypothetical protein